MSVPFVPYPSDSRDPSDAQSVPGMPSLALLMETDHLLDRLGDRSPRPADLDDPLAAALALLAADVDIEPMTSNTTRRRLASVGAWPLRQDLRSAALESVPRLVDVRAMPDDHADDGAAEDTAAEDTAAEDTVDELDQGFVAARLAQTREVGIRLVPALVAAGAAIVLSMGAAAALSSGETLNPAKAVRDKVQEVTGGATTQSSPDGADALADAEGRGVPGLVSSGSAGGSGQQVGPGALPGASVSPTAAPSGIAGADGTSPGTLTPGLQDFLPVLPAPTLPGSSSAPGAGSTGTGSTGTASTGTGSSGTGSPATGSTGASSSGTSASTSSGSSGSASSSEPTTPEPTTPEPTPSLGATGSTTPPDPTQTTFVPTTTAPPTTAPVSGTASDDQSSAGQASKSVTAPARPLSVESPLPTAAEALPTSAILSTPFAPESASEPATGAVVATIPIQASLTASGGA